MFPLRKWGLRLRAFFASKQLDAELEEELRLHIEMETEANMARGMARDAARYAALREFGGLMQTAEAYRDQRGLPLIESLIQEFRYAGRRLARTPGFTLAALLILTLGIGANSAVFGLMNAVLFRPLPYERSDRLVLIWEESDMFGVKDSPVAPANFVDWKLRSRSFEDMGAQEDTDYSLTKEGKPEALTGAHVTAGLLRALRIRPLAGRLLRDEEDRPGTPKVALISERLWRTRWQADPNIIGKTITLNDSSHTIVGVLPAGSEPPSHYHKALGDVWTSFGSSYTPSQWAARGRHNWMVLARLRAGVSLEEADTEMHLIAAQLQREHRDIHQNVGAFVAPLRDHFIADQQRLLWILFATVGVLLLIACVNMANLLLSRSIGRRKELAVRTAMGASLGRIAGHFLSESLLLCGAGGLLGFWLATPILRVLARVAPATLPGLQDLSADWRVIGFTLAVSFGTAAAFAILPLLHIRRTKAQPLLSQSSRAMGLPPGSGKLRSALIGAEISLAFVLLIGAGLLLRTFLILRATDLGCRTERVLTLKLPLYSVQRTRTQITAFQTEVLRRVHAIPGVLSAGFTNHIPLTTKGDISSVGAEGYDKNTSFQCRHRVIGPGYLQTMNIPILHGRDVDARDNEHAPPVVWINDTLARTLWPGQNPIGRRLRFGKNGYIPVVGVLADVRQAGLDEPPPPAFYFSSMQDMPLSLAVHTKMDPDSVVAAVRRAVWAADPDLPITDLAAMEHIVDQELAGRRMQMFLLTAIAGLGWLLATAGVYGILSYLVVLQTAEIGVRMALGAGSISILRSVMQRCLRPTLIGILLGGIGARMLSGLLESYLYGVKPTDPLTYAATATVLMLTAAMACYLPARRAARIDPIIAMRCD